MGWGQFWTESPLDPGQSFSKDPKGLRLEMRHSDLIFSNPLHNRRFYKINFKLITSIF